MSVKNNRFIEVKISKATLFLTPEEFEAAIKRGKGALRARSLKKRIEDVRPSRTKADNA